MSLHLDVRELNADDDTLLRYCQAGDFPVLVLTAAHLSGDLSLLRPEWTPTYAMSDYACGLSAEQEAQGRALCFDTLKAFRDSGRPVPGRPGYDFMQTVLQWTWRKDAESMHRLLDEQIVFGSDDAQAPQWTKVRLAPERNFHVCIVGAGISGLLAGWRLKQAGVPFTIFEKNSEVGGTWLENSYPGCRVDGLSFVFSYTFAQQAWPEYFGTRDEVLAYLKGCAKALGLYQHIRFDTEVLDCRWDESKHTWDLSLRRAGGDGKGDEQAKCNVLISAVGQLNRPSLPDIEGRDSFTGAAFHSARWNHDIDFKGKRVAVIGTGASALQFTPHVAREAQQTTIFARTVPWLLPTPLLNKPVSDGLRWLLENLPAYAQWHRLFAFTPRVIGFLNMSVVDPHYPPTERAVSAANEAVRKTLSAWVEAQIQDRPDLRELLIPTVPPGAKRMPRDDGSWIATLKRDDVRCVTTGIERITPNGIRTVDGVEHEFDVLIYGTGFKASEFLMPMKVTGREGRDLHATWGEDARAYLGATIPGFPNLFCMYGPNTNFVVHGTSIVFVSECASRYVLDAVRLMLEKNVNTLEVRAEVHDRYNVRMDQANANRAWGFSKVSSWYKNRLGRITQNWPFTALELWRRTRQIDPQDYICR